MGTLCLRRGAVESGSGHVVTVTGVISRVRHRPDGHTGPMATFQVLIDSDLTAPEAWRRLLDLQAHSSVIPLTTVSGDVLEADRLIDGSRFVARTGVGPLAVDDAMVVESIVPPTVHAAGSVRIRKRGNVVRGRIELRVAPATTGCTVAWWQRIGVRGVPGVLDPLVSRVARAAYGRALRRLLAGA
jgi:hypothetical protein